MSILTAFCDLRYCPISYDFCVWLARAAKERDDRGRQGLHIVLIPFEQGLGGFARKWGEHDEAATRWRLWHIVMACVPLAGRNTTVTLAASREQAEVLRNWTINIGEEVWWPEGRCHLAGPLVDAARKGEPIPKLRATDAARRYVAEWFKGEGAYVTLTIRSQATHADRNSNTEAWQQLEHSMAHGQSVVRLTDTNVALASSRGIWAEIDPDLRLALYERAAMNLIGNNGPATLLWFSDAPFLQFGFGLPAENWTSHMAEHVSLKPGDQLPWAKPNQRLVWRPDSFDVMREEFEKIMEAFV